MAFKELAKKNESDLVELLAQTRKRLHELRFKAREGQLKNVREIRKTRLQIAHILTALQERNAS